MATNNFPDLQRVVREKCREKSENETYRLRMQIGAALGFKTSQTYWSNDEFEAAIKPLMVYAKKRREEVNFQAAWDKAEAAALQALKESTR